MFLQVCLNIWVVLHRGTAAGWDQEGTANRFLATVPECLGGGAQRDSRRIGLWRSARERAVWLLDVQRAEAAGSVAAAAYATVVLRDRWAAPSSVLQ